MIYKIGIDEIEIFNIRVIEITPKKQADNVLYDFRTYVKLNINKLAQYRKDLIFFYKSKCDTNIQIDFQKGFKI